MSRFSQLYLQRGQPTRDSARFRHRLAAYFSEKLSRQHNFECRQAFERETGTAVPWVGTTWVFSEVFKQAELRDVLDAITVVSDVLDTRGWDRPRDSWIHFVSRAMREENVGYSVDSSGVVHFHVDQEFERNRVATLAVLEPPQFGGVRAAFEEAYRYLDAEPQDTKASARSMFEAMEIAAKLIVPGADRLTRNLCVQKLREACLGVASNDATEREVVGNLFTSLGYWVDAVHDYRHGQAGHERIAPSEEAAVLILATGSAFLRQLAACAARMQHVMAPTAAQ